MLCKALSRAAPPALILWTLVACEADPGPAKAYLVYEPGPVGEYALQFVAIPGLDAPHEARGRAARLLVGGELRTDVTGNGLADADGHAMHFAGAVPPRLRFTLDAEGRAIARDFDTLMAVTTYRNLERAAAYFEGLGVSRPLTPFPVYYEAQAPLSALLPVTLFHDNAAYVPASDSFWFPPDLRLSDVPVRINAGIVLHEYAHAVFQRLVYADARGAPYNSSRRAWSDAAINALDATNEGLADTFAAVALGQPDAFAASIPAADRDVSKTRLLGLEMFAALAATPPEAYNAYAVGSVVASTLWALRSLTDDATLGRAILAAMRGSGEYVRARKSYHLAVFFNHLHAALPAAVRPQACAIFEARLVALQGALSCPR